MASNSVITQAELETFYNTLVKPYLLGTNYPNFAPIESGTTASDDYAVGALIVFGGRLCEVTTAITSGSTIAVGTNVKYTDVDEQLTRINSNLTDGIGNTNDIFRFGTDGSGNYGYIKKVSGADTFFPFRRPIETVGLLDRDLTYTKTDSTTVQAPSYAGYTKNDKFWAQAAYNAYTRAVITTTVTSSTFDVSDYDIIKFDSYLEVSHYVISTAVSAYTYIYDASSNAVLASASYSAASGSVSRSSYAVIKDTNSIFLRLVVTGYHDGGNGVNLGIANILGSSIMYKNVF